MARWRDRVTYCLDSPRGLLWLVLLLAAWRLLWLPGRFLDLDGAVYLRAVSDYARAFSSGDWLRLGLGREHYTAIEYWPPLFPALGGLVRALTGLSPVHAAQAVSWLSGWLTVVPVYALGARLFGHRQGLCAAALVGLSPPLSWYASLPRCDALYLSLLVSGLALAVRALFPVAGKTFSPHRWIGSALLGGACLALAYMTRFEGVAALVLCAVAILLLARDPDGPGWRRAAGVVGFLVIGFALTALPYLVHLARLNGGTPTVVTPQKRMYDAMEGVWKGLRGGSQRQFVLRYGAPALKAVDATSTEVKEMLAEDGQLAWHGPAHLPQGLATAARNWIFAVVAVALLTLAGRWREPRVHALGILWGLAVLDCCLMWWDPAARYYAFTAVVLYLWASPRIIEAWQQDGPLLCGPASLQVPLAAALVFGNWYLPAAVHFDVSYPLKDCLPAPPLAPLVGLCMVGTAAVEGWLLRRLPGPIRGLVVMAASLAVLLAAMSLGWLPGLGQDVVSPALLGLLALCLALFFLPDPASLSPRRLVLWCGVWIVVVGLQNLVAMRTVDAAFASLSTSPSVERVLASRPDLGRVMAVCEADVIRSGGEFVPYHDADLGDLGREGVDAVVMLEPRGHVFPSVAKALQEGVLVLLASFPAEPGCRSGVEYQWSVYTVNRNASPAR